MFILFGVLAVAVALALGLAWAFLRLFDDEPGVGSVIVLAFLLFSAVTGFAGRRNRRP